MLDFFEDGSPEKPRKALQLALGLEESRNKEKVTEDQFKDSQFMGAAQLKKTL